MTTNWAGNVTYAARRIERPTSVTDLQELVATSPRIRALGTRHSFSTVADGPGVLVSLESLPPRITIDPVSSTVTVAAGLRYGDVATVLHERGYALHNLASLPHLGIAGAVATGTHGSGDGNGCLATSVLALERVTAAGDLETIDRGDADFLGCVVGLGALGVVTSLTLDVEPTFEIRQDVYQDLPWEAGLDQLDEVLASAYSVSLFTTWRPDAVDLVWRKHRLGGAEPLPPADRSWHGATLATGPRHPLPSMPATHCTRQRSPGPWHERLPHFRLDVTPSSGDELQSEYLVPRGCGTAALDAVRALAPLVQPVLQVSEIRSVAADELWLSPAQGRDCVAIHFTWVKDPAAVEPVVEAVERALEPYDPRPHWGKVFGTDPVELASRYERFDAMRDLVAATDPDGVFRNAFLDRYLPAR